MTECERLPNRRASESFTFEANGLHFTATVSRYDDGRIAESFLNNHKIGNQSDTNARDAAILLSFALQQAPTLTPTVPGRCRPHAVADRRRSRFASERVIERI